MTHTLNTPETNFNAENGVQCLVMMIVFGFSFLSRTFHSYINVTGCERGVSPFMLALPIFVLCP